MTARAAWLIAAGLAGGAVLGVFWLVQPSPHGLLKPDDASVLAMGSELYGIHCASCHGASLEGQAEDWRVRDAEGFAPAPPTMPPVIRGTTRIASSST